MSRPIPEGVRVCTEHGPGFHPYCPACAIDSGRLPIAADRDSEVARLNTKPGWFAEAMREIMQDPKDALIRELIKAGTFLRQDLEVELYSRSVGADEWQSLLEWKAVIALARTTCPEAFDGCSETSQS